LPDWIDFQSGIFAFSGSCYRVRFQNDTLNEKLFCKHRQRVSTLKKWYAFAVKTRRCFAAVFACREVSRTLLLGKSQTLFENAKIFAKIRFTFGKPYPRRRSGGERDKLPLSIFAERG